MTEIVSWDIIALRLFLTIVAGVLIGFNRGGQGERAGLRTTLLVCLAASIAMLQANLLLGVRGKAPDSYVVLDLMRLPLGILTGVGFIGAGAIFRQNNLVRGVTTAATLWFVTVIGLCFGGGQIGLGIAGTTMGVAALWGLKAIEERIAVAKSALLVMTAAPTGPTTDDIRGKLRNAGLRIVKFSETLVNGGDPHCTTQWTVQWRGLPHDTSVPSVVEVLAKTDGVSQLQWKT
ncbi:MAG TPA: MgtC/SapB family protein [Xanthobacteraceae bacterium]|jgi:putative Mg2+ transporter-C (MgtC) family protein